MERVRKSVWDLEGDPNGQQTLLRLEKPTKFTTDVNKGRGLVFDFEEVSSTANSGDDIVEAVRSGKAMTRLPHPVCSLSATFATASANEYYSTDLRPSFSAGSTGAKPKYFQKRKRPNKWRRQAQKVKETKANGQNNQREETNEANSAKRKATEEVMITSKLAKRIEEEVVPHEEPPNH
ncbi:uncharacterized protein LOC111830610 [Capsella rubella]|uniref:uncharacterized protein LOC111830610 n=1 Tax=Capsella rubella TaxID=81985 RepID=UPI000CD4F097|nr:uncharacterized protein LOC111830610 [Capsella rubella]